ncbi:MAG: ATP-binding protein [Gammaproteobacteria bacterium]|nr:ATP-binding protein [Gammaproteobacteria bacterium]
MMLIEFSVENYRSIKDQAQLSLVADSSQERRNTHVVEVASGSARPIALLRSAGIYGANAAGKTNLLKALETMRQVVTRSATELDALPITPFRFDMASETKPATFELQCLAGGVRYQYGFSATQDTIVGEWLYAWPNGRLQTWFERRASGSVKFGDKLLGDKEVWRRSTRPNALLLSTAITLNSVQLRPLFDWFDIDLRVAVAGVWGKQFTVKCCEGQRKHEVIGFLQQADLAVSGIQLVEEGFSPHMISGDMPSALREAMARELSDAKIIRPQLSHRSTEGRTVEIDLDEESDGTQKIFALAGPWIDALENGYVVVLDELHGHLHPALVRFLIELFHDPKRNSQGAQLIFSTHETSILNQEVFRRDQIWFCERGRELATTLFPLTDFRPRKGVENLERSYLAGRYGAVPHLRSAQAVNFG